MKNTPAPRNHVPQDAAMLTLIDHVVRKHREAAQGHERAGRHAQAAREYDMVRRIENYLAGPRGQKQRGA